MSFAPYSISPFPYSESPSPSPSHPLLKSPSDSHSNALEASPLSPYRPYIASTPSYYPSIPSPDCPRSVLVGSISSVFHVDAGRWEAANAAGRLLNAHSTTVNMQHNQTYLQTVTASLEPAPSHLSSDSLHPSTCDLSHCLSVSSACVAPPLASAADRLAYLELRHLVLEFLTSKQSNLFRRVTHIEISDVELDDALRAGGNFTLFHLQSFNVRGLDFLSFADLLAALTQAHRNSLSIRSTIYSFLNRYANAQTNYHICTFFSEVSPSPSFSWADVDRIYVETAAEKHIIHILYKLQKQHWKVSMKDGRVASWSDVLIEKIKEEHAVIQQQLKQQQLLTQQKNAFDSEEVIQLPLHNHTSSVEACSSPTSSPSSPVSSPSLTSLLSFLSDPSTRLFSLTLPLRTPDLMQLLAAYDNDAAQLIPDLQLLNAQTRYQAYFHSFAQLVDTMQHHYRMQRQVKAHLSRWLNTQVEGKQILKKFDQHDINLLYSQCISHFLSLAHRLCPFASSLHSSSTVPSNNIISPFLLFSSTFPLIQSIDLIFQLLFSPSSLNVDILDWLVPVSLPLPQLCELSVCVRDQVSSFLKFIEQDLQVLINFFTLSNPTPSQALFFQTSSGLLAAAPHMLTRNQVQEIYFSWWEHKFHSCTQTTTFPSQTPDLLLTSHTLIRHVEFLIRNEYSFSHLTALKAGIQQVHARYLSHLLPDIQSFFSSQLCNITHKAQTTPNHGKPTTFAQSADAVRTQHLFTRAEYHYLFSHSLSGHSLVSTLTSLNSYATDSTLITLHRVDLEFPMLNIKDVLEASNIVFMKEQQLTKHSSQLVLKSADLTSEYEPTDEKQASSQLAVQPHQPLASFIPSSSTSPRSSAFMLSSSYNPHSDECEVSKAGLNAAAAQNRLLLFQFFQQPDNSACLRLPHTKQANAYSFKQLYRQGAQPIDSPSTSMPPLTSSILNALLSHSHHDVPLLLFHLSEFNRIGRYFPDWSSLFASVQLATQKANLCKNYMRKICETTRGKALGTFMDAIVKESEFSNVCSRLYIDTGAGVAALAHLRCLVGLTPPNMHTSNSSTQAPFTSRIPFPSFTHLIECIADMHARCPPNESQSFVLSDLTLGEETFLNDHCDDHLQFNDVKHARNVTLNIRDVQDEKQQENSQSPSAEQVDFQHKYDDSPSSSVDAIQNSLSNLQIQQSQQYMAQVQSAVSQYLLSDTSRLLSEQLKSHLLSSDQPFNTPTLIQELVNLCAPPPAHLVACSSPKHPLARALRCMLLHSHSLQVASHAVSALHVYAIPKYFRDFSLSTILTLLQHIELTHTQLPFDNIDQLIIAIRWRIDEAESLQKQFGFSYCDPDQQPFRYLFDDRLDWSTYIPSSLRSCCTSLSRALLAFTDTLNNQLGNITSLHHSLDCNLMPVLTHLEPQLQIVTQIIVATQQQAAKTQSPEFELDHESDTACDPAIAPHPSLCPLLLPFLSSLQPYLIEVELFLHSVLRWCEVMQPFLSKSSNFYTRLHRFLEMIVIPLQKRNNQICFVLPLAQASITLVGTLHPHLPHLLSEAQQIERFMLRLDAFIDQLLPHIRYINMAMKHGHPQYQDYLHEYAPFLSHLIPYLSTIQPFVVRLLDFTRSLFPSMRALPQIHHNSIRPMIRDVTPLCCIVQHQAQSTGTDHLNAKQFVIQLNRNKLHGDAQEDQQHKQNHEQVFELN